jgi:hypothetical protein
MSAPDPGVAAAQRLLALAHEELAVVRDGDATTLDALHARRDAVMGTLPPSLSPAARALLEEVVVVQREAGELLAHSMGVLRGELGLVARGRRLARGYAPVRTPMRTLLDRTA